MSDADVKLVEKKLTPVSLSHLVEPRTPVPLEHLFECLHYLFISDLLGKAARQNVQYLEMVRAAIESDSADPVAWCTLHNLCLSVHEYDSPTMIEPYNYLTGHTGRGPMMAFTWKQMNCSGGASIRLYFYLEEKKAYCKVDKGSPILQPLLPPDFWREMGCE
jgi:hypothetical protein